MRCARSPKCGLENPGTIQADAVERTAASKKLSRAVIFCLFFMLVEVAGGLYANSLAILTDAAHLLSDIAGFAISLFAIWATSWEATPCQTFGFYRLEILGALVSIQFIWLMTGMLLYEAIQRLLESNDDPVDGAVMFFVACLGLFVNLGMMLLLGGHGHSHSGYSHGHIHGEDGQSLGGDHAHTSTLPDVQDQAESHALVCTGHDNGNPLHKRHKEGTARSDDNHVSKCSRSTMSKAQNVGNNINVQGAYLHVLGDLIQSAGVMVGGAAIWYNPEWKVIDLICTLLFSVLVLGTTIQMIRDILHILMESTPREIDARAVKHGLLEIPGMVAIHEFHIWAITLGKTLLSCHIQVQPHVDTDEVLQAVTSYLETNFKISHATIQVERAK